jgi:hypothetical protein
VQIQEIASFLQARRADTALAGGDSHRMGFANYPPLPSKRVLHDLDDQFGQACGSSCEPNRAATLMLVHQ